MRITVCQLRDEESGFAADWTELCKHTRRVESDVVVLPEMPFHPWLFHDRRPDTVRWEEAEKAHEAMIGRLGELGEQAVVFSSRPVTLEGRRLNEGFVWSAATGYRPVHHKRYLPDEPGFWEAAWYERGAADEFSVARSPDLVVGMLICTDLWFMQHARSLGKAGAVLLAVPRSTPLETRGKWVSGGAVAAVVSGAFCASSNRAGRDDTGMDWAGAGWLADPDGEMLTVTSDSMPYSTVEVELENAEAAKASYPRYVED